MGLSSFWWFDNWIGNHFPRRASSSPLKIEFLQMWFLYLEHHLLLMLVIYFVDMSWVTIIFSCFHGPHWAYVVSQHHRVTLVQGIHDRSPLHPWIRIYDLRKLGFLQAPKFHLKHVIVKYSLYVFFYKGSHSKIKTHLSQNILEAWARISDLGSLYFQRYGPRNLWFLEAPKLHPK